MYLPDITDRYPEGYDGIDMTDRLVSNPRSLYRGPYTGEADSISEDDPDYWLDDEE